MDSSVIVCALFRTNKNVLMFSDTVLGSIAG